MIYESSTVSMGPTLKRRKSQEGVYSLDKNSVREWRSQSRAKEMFNVILSAGLLNGKGTSMVFILKICLDFYPRDISAGCFRTGS